jgi:dipeptidyl aminopeptidase/acylaminoacyl peptidase
LEDISPDDQRLLISQSFPDYTVRPYTQQVMMELNLQTFTVDTLWVTRFGGSALYSPDGKQLLVTGSPSMFNGAGNVLKKGVIPNDFDTQAYLFTIADHTVTPLTRQFNPSILQSYWNAVDQQIYFLTADGSYQDIWKLNPVNHQFQKLNNHVDVITQMSFAAKSPLLSYSGTSISSPATGWLYDLNHNTETLLSNPEKTFFEHVQFGKIENWNFVNKQGYTIEGWVYYPPHFDPTRKYPVIVYYYGGTEPTVRDCGSRYPLNLFAAMGYIVYTLNPSGSIGYGQAFSALHVNGWGKENAQDIIEGTKKFLETHSNADAQNVGCIGASYGGYMTLWLQTQTNLFKTAVDHAGISFIGSYWGQGFWGYSYSAVASANSFPWNNKNLYVDQSPLFNADKVHSSILLLQGTADTNVPTGESIQFYTAMKILGKNADLVEVKGQDHHILDYKDRILWQKTIFAWFAKYLKNEPEWWDALYPHKDL